MQLRLKIDSIYQPSPQKKVEEKRREGGKSSFDRIGLEKVAVKLSVQEMRQSFCVKH